MIFPASPSIDDTYTLGGTTWTWDGTVWMVTSEAVLTVGNIDGGKPNSLYGGTTPVDGGGV